MKKVLVYSVLLLAGLVGSQILPGVIGDRYQAVFPWITPLTMVCLGYIMIGVGREFDIDKSNLRQYGWDYVVAATAAAFPWIFCCLYFVFVLIAREHRGEWAVWKEALLTSRFAAPTSAGVLFSMLAAAGLAATWVFRKARILAIFDDLDTVLLMIPLKMAMVGFRWQLVIVVLIMTALLGLAYYQLRRWRLPDSWPALLGYSVAMVVIIEVIHHFSLKIDPKVPIHIEVLLPAFVLGCLMRYPEGDGHDTSVTHGTEHPRADTWINSCFMVLVGLSMPAMASMFHGSTDPGGIAAVSSHASALTADTPTMGWGMICLHVVIVTALSNLGKMFPALCYRKEARWQERLAVAIGMWPRGEVGAGVLVISLSYGIGGPIVVIAMLSLALNLVLTGVFIWWVKRLLASANRASGISYARDRESMA